MDHYSVNQDEQSIKERKEKIQEILKELDIKFRIEIIEIIEISSINLENIEDLQIKIWNIISNHSYMGEKVPVSYLTIKDEISQSSNMGTLLENSRFQLKINQQIKLNY